MKLLVSALEHSANVHLAALKKELSDDVEFIGIFDKKLGNPLIDLRALSVMGIIDAFKKLPFFLRLKKQMVGLAQEADKVLLIDASGFNLPLAKAIKKDYPDKEIIYYILPQAWAWRTGRIKVLEQTIDRLCSILPFEKEYYSQNTPIEYVGHPLLDEIEHFKETPSDVVKTVTFMPGSRRNEIKRMMGVFHRLRPMISARALLVIPSYFTQEEINELYGNLTQFEIVCDAHEALHKSDFAFICSGTATLEAALIGTPFILGYIAKPLDYMIARKLVKLNHVGLSNLLFERFEGRIMHPELIQDDVTADAFFDLFETMDHQAFVNDSIALRRYLQHGSSRRVAQIIEGKHEN